MLTLVVGLGFILLGTLPYGYFTFWLLKEPKELEGKVNQDKKKI